MVTLDQLYPAAKSSPTPPQLDNRNSAMAGHPHEVSEESESEEKLHIPTDLQKPLSDVSSSTELETVLSTLGAYQSVISSLPAFTPLLLANSTLVPAASTGKQLTAT